MINVILFRGLWGSVYSRGLDVLAMKLKKMKNVDYVMVDSYQNWKPWVNRISSFKDPTILIGHSFGVMAIAYILKGLNKDIPLVVSFDPSQYSRNNTMYDNAKKVINFYQKSWWPFGIGNQKLKRPNGSFKNITNLQKDPVSHVAIDDRVDLHEEVIKLLKDLGK